METIFSQTPACETDCTAAAHPRITLGLRQHGVVTLSGYLTCSMDEEGMMTRSSWAPGHMRWLLNRVCHTGGSSAWDSASSANLGSR